jgi:hypothetical protein
MSKTLLFFFLLTVTLQAQLSPGDWRTDLSRKSIDLSELKLGGPPKNGIPAIDRPRFVDTDRAASWLGSKEPVLVVEHGDEARSYPLQILIWHELVNDQVGDLPILVSFCPLCNSALVFDRRLGAKVYDFGVSGMLRHSDMVMYDRQTDSLWQQITGDAIVGSLTGKKLTVVSSQIVSFETFSKSFPDGKVLSRETGHRRPYGQNPYVGYEFGNRLFMPVRFDRSASMKPLERIVTISQGSTTRAYPLSLLRRHRVVEDRVNERGYVILHEPGTVTPLDRGRIADSRDVGSVGVFSAEIEGRRLSFRRRKGKTVDEQTGSIWNVLGIATEGRLAGKRLTPVEHGVYFAFAWLVFHPETYVVGDVSGLSATQP